MRKQLLIIVGCSSSTVRPHRNGSRPSTNGDPVPTRQRHDTQKVRKVLRWPRAWQRWLAMPRKRKPGKRCHNRMAPTLLTITLRRWNVDT